jgi:outer membrane receptor protein involved in Fe transport
LATVALTPAMICGAARAADPAPAAAPNVQGQDIVVTATRKAQSLSKVAESVSAFTAKKMDIEGIKSFADIAKFTPGVTYDEDRHDIAIRGVTSKAGSGTTGIYIDDTPIQIRALGLNANNTLPAVFDLDRVEILRGPQGTLFGAGSEGGTIRYITPQPSLTRDSGYTHADLSTTQGGAPSYEVGGAYGGPIVNDVLGFRVSAWARRDGGWINTVDPTTLAVTDSGANRTDTYVVRGALAWAPTANLLVTPSIEYQKIDEHNNSVYWTAISDPSAGQFRDGTPDRMADADRFYLPSLKIEYDLGSVKLIANTSYFNRREVVNGYSGTLYNLSFFQHYTQAGTDPQGAPNCNNCIYPLLTPTGPNLPGFGAYVAQNWITNTQENFTQEVRLQSTNPDARLSWVTGVFYSHANQRSTEEIKDPQLADLTEYLWGEDLLTAWGENLLPGEDDYINDTKAHDQQIALFADGTFAITSKLKAELGVRYAWTHFDYANHNDGPQDLLDDGGVPATAAGKKNETPLTPKFGLTYQLTNDDLLYATVAKGYRIGGATPPLPSYCGTGFPSQYNSDTVLSYEIGAKGRFLDRKLQLAASAYYIDWTNIQQAIYVTVCGIQYTTNVGDAISKGFDVQGQYQITHGLSVDFTVGYTDAEYSKDSSDPVTGAILALKGDALDVVPLTVTLGAQYDFTLWDQDAYVRADYDYASHRTRPIPNEDPNTQNLADPTLSYYDPGLRADPAVTQVSARAGTTLKGYDLAVYVENLFDAHPRLDLQHQDQQTLLYEAETLRPRTVGISLSHRF